MGNDETIIPRISQLRFVLLVLRVYLDKLKSPQIKTITINKSFSLSYVANIRYLFFKTIILCMYLFINAVKHMNVLWEKEVDIFYNMLYLYYNELIMPYSCFCLTLFVLEI